MTLVSRSGMRVGLAERTWDGGQKPAGGRLLTTLELSRLMTFRPEHTMNWEPTTTRWSIPPSSLKRFLLQAPALYRCHLRRRNACGCGETKIQGAGRCDKKAHHRSHGSRNSGDLEFLAAGRRHAPRWRANALSTVFEQGAHRNYCERILPSSLDLPAIKPARYARWSPSSMRRSWDVSRHRRG